MFSFPASRRREGGSPVAAWPGIVKRGIFVQRKGRGQKTQSVKSYHKDEETVTILCQFLPGKKLEFPCGERLWKSLWRMWKTLSYQQVFRPLALSAPGIGNRSFAPPFPAERVQHKTGRYGAFPSFFRRKVGFLLDIPDKHPASPKSAAENLWIIHKLDTSGEMGMIAAALEILFL